MDKILADRTVARIFFIAFGLITVVLAVMSYFLHGSSVNWAHTAGDFLDKALTSLLVTVMLGSFLFYIAPRFSSELDVTPLKSDEIRDHLFKALSGTLSYAFLGSTGRFIRASVIPALVRAYQQNQRRCRLDMVLLDPGEEAACAAYSEYRKSLELTGEAAREAIHIKADVVAVVLVALRAMQRKQLDVTVHLSKTFGVFRVDYSDHCAILTKEHPAAGGLLCNKGGQFYNLWRAEIDVRRDQARPVNALYVAPSGDGSEELKAFIIGSHILPQTAVTDELIIEVQRSLKGPDPYASSGGLLAAFRNKK